MEEQWISNFKKIVGLRDGKLYLLQSLNPSFGYFVSDGCLIFGQRLSGEDPSPLGQINTEFLSLIPSIKVVAIANDPTYPEGFFNLLKFSGEPNSTEWTSFLRLTSLFASSPSASFYDFFSSLVDLFQLPKKQAVLDTIGLFGELSLLKTFYEAKHIDLSNLWHVAGPYSKYDVSSKAFNLEIKTTVTDSTTFNLKHSQVFNESAVFIGLAKLSDAGNGGSSLAELVQYFKTVQPFSENLHFQINLEKELMAKQNSNFASKRFQLDGLFFFDAHKLETIRDIPFCINEIHYEYTFDLGESLGIDQMAEQFSDLLE